MIGTQHSRHGPGFGTPDCRDAANTKRMPLPNAPEIDLRVQYGVLPYRWCDTGGLEILLITSRRTRRWIVPKGWPMKGRKPWQTAEIEAREEAGVTGALGHRTIGSFRYSKQLDDDGRVIPCEVVLFPLLVDRSMKSWGEKLQRDRCWLAPSQASSLAADPELRDLIVAFANSLHTPT